MVELLPTNMSMELLNKLAEGLNRAIVNIAYTDLDDNSKVHRMNSVIRMINSADCSVVQNSANKCYYINIYPTFIGQICSNISELELIKGPGRIAILAVTINNNKSVSTAMIPIDERKDC